MSNHVSWMLELDVNDGRETKMAGLMDEMSAATKTNEPNTLCYEWNFSPDGKHCHLWERYADSDAAMVHIATFGEKYAGRFMDVFTPTRLTVYGSPSDAVRNALDGMGAACMATTKGFSR
ncbi:MAG: antibiotic biosynthesis monooxygenase [Gemmatimonadales bacterium]